MASMDRVAQLRERLRILRLQAERTRRLVLQLADSADRERLLDFIADLDRLSTDLEEKIEPRRRAPGARVETQQQVQQQQGRDKKGDKDDKNDKND
jgi:hypothetical protein